MFIFTEFQKKVKKAEEAYERQQQADSWTSRVEELEKAGLEKIENMCRQMDIEYSTSYEDCYTEAMKWYRVGKAMGQ